MSDDLATQLRKQASSDHVRGCQGRQYSCDCGYDIRGEGLLEQAATALTEARAEIERLKSGINGIVNCQGPMTRAQVREVCAEILDNKTVGLNNQSPFAEAMFGNKARAEKAESALAEAVDERDRLRDDIRQLWDFGTEELRVCEHCDAWMTIEEAARIDDVSLCPREAYGSVKFPDEKCFKHRAWVVKEERDNTRRFIASQEPAEEER